MNESAKLRYRRFERIVVDLPVIVATPTQTPNTLRLAEIGEGGCLTVGKAFLGSGRVVNLTAYLDYRPVSAIAKVQHEYRNETGEVCSGMEFQHLGEESLETVRHYMNLEFKKVAAGRAN